MFVLFVKGYWPSNPYPFLGGQVMATLGIKMGLVSETIKILDSTFVDGVSLLDFVYQSYDPKYGSWSGDSLTNIEKALDRAAKTLPKSQLIKEFNELAGQNECDQITGWDYDTQTMDLEIFIDEVFQQIQELKSA